MFEPELHAAFFALFRLFSPYRTASTPREPANQAGQHTPPRCWSIRRRLKQAYGCRGQSAPHVADGEARIFATKGITESERGVIRELKLVRGRTARSETARRPRRRRPQPGHRESHGQTV